MKNKILIYVLAFAFCLVFNSCEKENIKQDSVDQEFLMNYKKGNHPREIKVLEYDFVINFKKNGNYSVSDNKFLISYPEIRVAFQNIQNKVRPMITSGNDLVLTINSQGIINSSDNSIIASGRNAQDLLILEGEMQLLKADLIIEYDKNGFKRVSHPVLFSKLPGLIRRNIISAGDHVKNNIDVNKKLFIKITPHGNISHGIVNALDNTHFIDYEVTASGDDCSYEDFKDCVGDWWYLPLINVVACGVWCIILHVF